MSSITVEISEPFQHIAARLAPERYERGSLVIPFQIDGRQVHLPRTTQLPPGGPWLSVLEFARLSGQPVWRLQRWIGDGRLKSTKHRYASTTQHFIQPSELARLGFSETVT